MIKMNRSFLLRLLPLIAARAVLRPYPGWRLGIGQSESNTLLRLRRRLWNQLKTPCMIRWLDRLRVYLYPGNEISRAIFLTGYYEPNEFFWLEKTLKAEMSFIDVGANMGLYTQFAAKKVGPHGIVVAIEPSSRDFARLKAHIELNRLANVHLLQVAVSNYEGEADLLVAAEEKSGHNTLGSFGYDSVIPQGRERVRVEQLDDIVQRIGLQQVDLIKMDIEGAEFLCLQGAKEILSLFHPIILMELSDRTLRHQGCHSGQIWEFLTQEGYHIYALREQTGLIVSAERKPYFDSENIVAIHNAVGAGALP
jgi:FkbM family methyltransferase